MKLFDVGHCSPHVLVDLAEGTRSEEEVPHLALCASCRQQVLALQSVLAEARAVPVPEPSPLFWDHLSATVREAIAAEGESRPAARRRWWLLFPVAATVGVVLVAILQPPRRPPAGTPAPIVTAGPGQTEPPVELASKDVSIELLGELVSRVDLETLELAGLDAPAGLADLALVDLSADEQLELVRLLNQALGRPGV